VSRKGAKTQRNQEDRKENKSEDKTSMNRSSAPGSGELIFCFLISLRLCAFA
jgi:hypothetical protein